MSKNRHSTRKSIPMSQAFAGGFDLSLVQTLYRLVSQSYRRVKQTQQPAGQQEAGRPTASARRR